MPTEQLYAVIILAVVAIFTGVFYLRLRRIRVRKKGNQNAVRPAAPARAAASPAPQTAVATWAPPVTSPRPGSVASTVVAAPPQPATPRRWRYRSFQR